MLREGLCTVARCVSLYVDSNSYKEAMADIAQYFPRGIYCQSTIYHQVYRLHTNTISLVVVSPLLLVPCVSIHV